MYTSMPHCEFKSPGTALQNTKFLNQVSDLENEKTSFLFFRSIFHISYSGTSPASVCHHFLRPISSKARSTTQTQAISLEILSRPLGLPGGHSWGPETLQRPTIPCLLSIALAIWLPVAPAATSLDSWLLSGSGSNLSHLTTHLSAATTVTFCYHVAQMLGNLILGVKGKAISDTTQHLEPFLLPFTAWGRSTNLYDSGHRDQEGLIHPLQSLGTTKTI